MLDIKLIRNDKEGIEKKLKTKDPLISLDEILRLDQAIREGKTKVETLKATRNEVSKQIGDLKRQGVDFTQLSEKISSHGEEIDALDKELTENESHFQDLMSRLPNIPMDEIPISPDPKDNVMLKQWGDKPSFNFPFKNHVELNESLQLFDFKRGAKIAGSGWPIYKNWGARIEWALLQYMMSVHIKNGFIQWIPPIVVKPEVMYEAGQLPKFANQQFKITDEAFQLFMIPTAEVALNGLHSDEIIPLEDLPLRYVAYTPCFRREAGAAGAQERGLIRMHQFNKIEMFCFTLPEDAPKIFEEMIKSAEGILQGLGLHYRNMLLTTGDMSFAGAKTIDIEVWLPGQNRYYEVSSVTNCTDFQARRSNCRSKRSKEAKSEFVYTLNGSGLATSRLMVGLLENNQNEDGSINIPDVLQPYLNGLTCLKP